MYKKLFKKITFRTYELNQSLFWRMREKGGSRSLLNCSNLRSLGDQSRYPGEFTFCRILRNKCEWKVGREEERSNMY